MYVSDNFAPTGAEKFFDKVLAPFYDQHITLHTLAHHPTKVLFELFQSQGCQSFEITKEAIDPEKNEHGHSIESQGMWNLGVTYYLISANFRFYFTLIQSWSMMLFLLVQPMFPQPRLPEEHLTWP